MYVFWKNKKNIKKIAKNYSNLIFVVVNLFCMRVNVFKNFLSLALAVAVIILGCCCKATNFAYADSKVDYINYISFGDSIASGYGLDGYDANADFITGSYETLFKSYLQTGIGEVNGESYAVDGSTSSDLLNLLQNNTSVRESVKKADIITISIGGNDLAKPAKSQIVTSFITGYDALKQELATAVNNYATNVAGIISEINSLNANVKVLFTSLFNPYKSLSTATNTVSLLVTGSPLGDTSIDITPVHMQDFATIAETYIAGENAIKGINQVIQESIEDYDNFYYIDTKKSFDEYQGDYTDVARASLVKQTSITMTFDEAYNQGKMMEYLDPHPTGLGHQIFAREFQTGFASNLALIKIDYNGSEINNYIDDKYIVKKDTTITAPTAPEKLHYTFKGWSHSQNSYDEYDFTEKVVSNLTLYASWEAITYKVKFDFNGGKIGNETFSEVSVAEGLTLDRPSGDEVPSRIKYEFVDWYKDSACTELFDFETPINEDTVVYAKWTQVAFDVVFNYNGGTVGDKTSDSVIVNRDGLITEPTGDSVPVKLDYNLVGWFTENTFVNEWNFAEDRVTEDVILYAKWECSVWYVTFNFNGGNVNGVNNQVIKVIKGGKLADPNYGDKLKRPGFMFKFWYTNDESVPFDFENTEIISDLTLNAKWQNAIMIKMHYGDYMTDSIPMAIDATIADLAIPTRNGTVFYGWFKDSSCQVEYSNPNEPLTDGTIYYIKWVTLICEQEELLVQEYSPLSRDVTWFINARAGSEVSWQVNGLTVDGGTGILTGNGISWTFVPSNYGVGNFVITCLVNGSVVNGKTLQLKYSTPTDIFINLDSVVDKTTYLVEVDNKQYYDASKFVWYKTSDPYSDDFSEEIGKGFVLNYTFDNDCNICVKYIKDDSTEIMSNVIKVSVDNHIDTITMVALIATILIVAVIVVSAVLSYRRNKEI